MSRTLAISPETGLANAFIRRLQKQQATEQNSSSIAKSCKTTRRKSGKHGVVRKRGCITKASADNTPGPTTQGVRQGDLQGKSVVVVGLGASGKAAARLALARGAERVTACDRREDMKPLQDEEHFAGLDLARLQVDLGPHNRATLANADLLIMSPGVNPVQTEIAAALEAGVPAISELAFAAEALPSSMPMAAITGTNGKSTVTTFTGQILREAGKRPFLGGNLGTPLSVAALECLAFPPDDPPYQAAIVEVSSYQLQFPGSLNPKVGVVLNLTPDHLERHGNMEAYGAAKCALFRNMSSSQIAAIPQGDSFLRRLAIESNSDGLRAWLGALPGVQLDSSCRRAIVAVPGGGPEALLDLSVLRCLGAHNAHNAGTAALLALSLGLGLTQDDVQRALPTLQPPPHRMEIVIEDSEGVLWIDDSKATNVEASMVGIRGVQGRKAVVLLGGRAKVDQPGMPFGFDRLKTALAGHRAVIAFGEHGPEIAAELADSGVGLPVHTLPKLKDAVERASLIAQRGDAVLLSPGCASFDEFTDFMHRGRAFSELVRQRH
ncbi:hypothetical protein KFL_000770010 [Klebsormidium nitens]|uniref:Uncharacterized protein n=1 Tax=Klebsormidium nitens TaxID=105231 RepID=A0A1Y1HXP0_KLENI|nr:hypothetical protein KFL_000770010 [Klebsormidium nitens]|eukprot:GAQ81307.1 hypothetical protein KFL_000770010 [Klebsormidium nitens]